MIWVGEKKLYQRIMIRWIQRSIEEQIDVETFLIKYFFDFLEDAEGRKNDGSDDELNK